MKVAILQTDVTWAQPEENIRHAEALMSEDADLYVLPEMWATGFCVRPEGIAENEESSVALQWMKDTSKARHCAISGSLAVRVADGSYRNRHYFVTPDSVIFYDKHHLFSYGKEQRYFTPGKEAIIANWKNMRLLLLTCYDLRFPVFSRYGIAGEYDAIVCVANWPASRQLAWQTLTKARAIENQCFMVAANRVGSDTSCQYNGESAIIDPLSRTLNEGGNQVAVITATINQEWLHEKRQQFRVLDDRDVMGG